MLYLFVCFSFAIRSKIGYDQHLEVFNWFPEHFVGEVIIKSAQLISSSFFSSLITNVWFQ